MQAKPWYESKTIWSLIVTALGLVLARWHVSLSFDDATLDQICSVAGQIAAVVGPIGALIGRLKAQTTITATKAQARAINRGLVRG